MRVKSRKPLAAKRKMSLGVRPRGERVDQREREHVRQVRDRGEHAVVRGRRRARARAAAGAPERRARAPTAAGSVSGQRRQHHVAVAEQRRERRRRARVLGAGDRMAGTKRGNARAERGARRRDHVLLGAAGVGDDVARPEAAGHRREQRRILRDRRRDQHEVGVRAAPPSSRRRARRPVDDAAARSAASRLARPRPTPTTVPTRRRARSASANEPPIRPTPTTTSLPMRVGALHRGWTCAARAQPASAARAAPRGSGAFSSGRPMVTRSYSGSAVVGDRPHDDALLAAARW